MVPRAIVCRLLPALLLTATLGTAPARPALAAAGTASAASRGLALDYTIYFGGFEVLRLDIGLALTERRYNLEAAMRTLGFVSRLYPWSMRASASGLLLDGARVRPAQSRSENVWRDKKGWVTMRFEDGTPTVVSAKPPRGRAPAPAASLRDAVDVASAILAISRSGADGKACDVRVPVFDGRRRFDFVVSRLGAEHMEKSRYSAFTGDAVMCRVAMAMVSGKKKERDYGGFGSEGRTATVWLGPVFDGVLPMPVRIEYGTRWGLIIAHLARARLTGDGGPREIARLR